VTEDLTQKEAENEKRNEKLKIYNNKDSEQDSEIDIKLTPNVTTVTSDNVDSQKLFIDFISNNQLF
jgi:hypothetical protein